MERKHNPELTENAKDGILKDKIRTEKIEKKRFDRFENSER